MPHLRDALRVVASTIGAWLLAAEVGGAEAPASAEAATPSANVSKPEFSRDVRPIFARHCLKCHGPDPDHREAGLRIDERDTALRGGESGAAAIVPGQPDHSEIIRRVTSTDADRVMPPAAAKNPLDEREQRVLREWIAAGAEYQPHWAFAPPRPTPPPAVLQTAWPRNPIDQFVLARLEAAGLRPAPPADRHTLARRVSLDLVGLPPTPEEADAFALDAAPDAYERLVDRLLASPHYGERWARRWLDMARYADTNGYEKDRPRSIWPYRDWVIAALNADMPFDRFTTEQLAGDMLPGATTDQRIATGFHRNTMRNEEGGIDPLEYQFYAMTDRVATTSTIWLGLTMGCAQCHTHKYDPITHREYYQFFALLNNADEPELSVPKPDIAEQRAAVERQVAAIEAGLAERFPAADESPWRRPTLVSATSQSGATLTMQSDGAVLVSGADPERDAYTLTLDTHGSNVTGLRIEALNDPTLPNQGPGRTPHGNFVLSELAVTVAPLPDGPMPASPAAFDGASSSRPADGSQRDPQPPEAPRPVKLVNPIADFSQTGFSVERAVDGNPATGWAIHGPGKWNVPRTATFDFEQPVAYAHGARFTVRLDQNFGKHHALGKFRVALREPATDPRPLAERRRENLEWRFAAWLANARSQSVAWAVLRPSSAKSEVPSLDVLDDDSVLVSGDKTKRDVYDLTFDQDLAGVTALRLEALPDERLPRGGPGRVDYEGPFGDFFLCECTLTADGQKMPFSAATATFAKAGNTIDKAIDGEVLTGWSIDGGQGQKQMAVFNFAAPLPATRGAALSLLFEKYYAAGLGRFRVSVTRDLRPAVAVDLPAEIEALLQAPSLGEPDLARLKAHFLTVAPELASVREEIKRLRDQAPKFPTTLVLQERPASHPRATFMRRRGEYLQPTERVEPDVPGIFARLPAANGQRSGRDRLALARWLTSGEHPLVGRVTMNRAWAAFFGRGLVSTGEDFGYQGQAPTHPELLDWLALEFVRGGWSQKQMHRLIVTSATYQQSSRLEPELAARDPENRLLARGPRVRIDAEMVRDVALQASGLLSEKMGGPSVFPPQPPGVSSEGAYGPLVWTVSTGEDRYRRGLYTFSKRTAPYAAFTTFDAPTGEVCVARREVSNTALQALTLLNDPVFVEAAQTLGRRTAAQPGSLDERCRWLFRRCLVRPPADEEVRLARTFYEAQRQRLERHELDAGAIGGPEPAASSPGAAGGAAEPGSPGAQTAPGHASSEAKPDGGANGDAIAAAAWTLLARALLNLDETITKN